MSSVLVETERDAGGEEDSRLMADLFHALNQPITALRCALELGLHQPRTTGQYRDVLQKGLEQAEQIAGWATGIRELLQAQDAGDACQMVAFESFLREELQDMQPVAESLRVSFALRCSGSAVVRFEPHRLRQTLFCLLDFALRSSRAGSVLQIEVQEHHHEAVLRMAGSPGAAGRVGHRQSPLNRERTLSLRRRLGLAIPRRLVEAAGGRLETGNRRGRWHIELGLPLATAAKDPPASFFLADQKLRAGNGGQSK